MGPRGPARGRVHSPPCLCFRCHPSPYALPHLAKPCLSTSCPGGALPAPPRSLLQGSVPSRGVQRGGRSSGSQCEGGRNSFPLSRAVLPHARGQGLWGAGEVISLVPSLVRALARPPSRAAAGKFLHPERFSGQQVPPAPGPQDSSGVLPPSLATSACPGGREAAPKQRGCADWLGAVLASALL